MLKHLKTNTLFVAFLLGAALTLPTFAAGPPALVGVWEAVSTLDGSGQQDRGLSTFHADGTFLARDAQGVWEKTGPNSFTATSVFLVRDSNGAVAFRVRVTTEISLAPGGQTFTAAFQSTTELLDGTVAATNTGTIASTRITL